MRKVYFMFDKILNIICEILEQILKKPGIFVNNFMKHNVKLKQKKLLVINFLRKII